MLRYSATEFRQDLTTQSTFRIVTPVILGAMMKGMTPNFPYIIKELLNDECLLKVVFLKYSGKRKSYIDTILRLCRKSGISMLALITTG